MPVVTLSVFALAIASGVPSSLIAGGISEGIKYALTPDVEKEIGQAFEKAFRKWARFKIGYLKETELKEFVLEVSKHPRVLENNISKEFAHFYRLFNKCLVKYHSAWSYLKEIKDEGRFLELKGGIESVKDDTQELLKIARELTKNNPSTLQDEWTKELEQYIKAIEQFKPQTALDLISALESRIQHRTISPIPQFNAHLSYNKAVCNLYLGNVEGIWNNYIRAYELLPQNDLYREKACLAYARTGDEDSCQRLIDEILAVDRCNSRAWFSKIVIEDQSELESLLSQTPLEVNNDISFQRLLYYHK